MERYRGFTYFSNAATAFSHKGRIEEASEILQREIALSEQGWGPGHPALASSLMSTAWTYINYLRLLKPAHELVERATRIVVATSGETSNQMAFIEQVRLRLAGIENDSAAVSEHTAKLRALWVAIHGSNTKPPVIH